MNIETILDLVAEYIENQDKIRSPFVPGVDEVPVSGATITSSDVVNIVEVALGRWYTEGDRHRKFANRLKYMLGGRSITLCNSGSSASLIATAACKEYFDRDRGYVITCATGFPTTITPAIQLGFVPYFVDINYKTLNIDIDTVLELIHTKKNLAGVILTHTLGFPFDAEKIRECASACRQFFIEDCADALGATIGDKPVGTFGDASIFSFFPAHHITTGEGGAISWNNGRLAKIGNSYCSWGRDCWCKPGDDNTCNNRFNWEFEKLPKGYDHKYTFTRLGYNLKMTELQAALGLSQVYRLDKFSYQRRNNFHYLYLNLPDIYEHINLVAWDAYNFRPSPFGFPITVTSKAFTRNELVSYLEENKIRTRPIFAGNLAKQPMMQSVPFLATDLTQSDFVMNNSFWIGCHDGLSIEQLDYVIERFDNFFRSRGL